MPSKSSIRPNSLYYPEKQIDLATFHIVVRIRRGWHVIAVISIDTIGRIITNADLKASMVVGFKRTTCRSLVKIQLSV